MQPVTPITNGDAILCTCGNTMDAHRCPSSVGYAPRQAKSNVCSACGLKQHQNLEGSTVRLECLWRQWAKASGQLQIKTGKTVRYAVPPPTVVNVAAFGAWLSSGRTDSIIAVDTGFAAIIDAQETTTASGAKRAEERAKAAPAMPNQSEPTEGVIRAMTSAEYQEAQAMVDAAVAAKDELVAADDEMEQFAVDAFPDLDEPFNDNDEPTNADLTSVTIQIPQEIAQAWAAEDYSEF